MPAPYDDEILAMVKEDICRGVHPGRYPELGNSGRCQFYETYQDEVWGGNGICGDFKRGAQTVLGMCDLAEQYAEMLQEQKAALPTLALTYAQTGGE